MCGIAGFTGFYRKEEAVLRLERMRSSLAHRGPDGRGTFHDPAQGTGLCHTRLSILDPGERSSQPMVLEGRWVLVFNGEIYNFRELRTACMQEGETFRTTSDTEVLLTLLARKGPAALERLRGMFALALWDTREQTLLLARDVFGIKPLYHTTASEPLAFASEISALVSSGWLPLQFDPRGVSRYFQRGSCDPSCLPLSGVRALEPGTWARHGHGKVETGRFAAIPYETPPLHATPDSLGRIWKESVRAHMESDVPVGVFLSGGIDSAALMAALHGQDIPMPASLTLSFPGTSWDESGQAGIAAHHFGSRHIVRSVDPLRELPEWFQEHLDQQDLPSIDGFNVSCISRIASEHGFKVVLSGLGGDELLGGYPSFRNIPRIYRAAQLAAKIPLAPRAAAGILAQCGSKGRRLASLFQGPPTFVRAARIYRDLFDPDTLTAMGLESREDWQGWPEGTSAVPFEITDLRSAVSALEVEGYLKNQLLRDADACSMAHGVELRVPFLDAPLWQEAAHLPPAVRYQARKKLLARALPGLPQEWFSRPKKGFSLPWETWLAGPLEDLWQDVPAQARPHCRTWYQRMAWITFTSWSKRLKGLP
jgi:asparagine synthase (glutamine-hydrolysing)